jgi:uncharacterized protein (TIGR00369 family)
VTVAVPAGFEPLQASPFTELIGPLYINRSGEVPVLGVEVQSQHANTLGRVHGGLLMTVADIALSRAVREHLPPGASMATADLHVAFLDGVAPGTWLEAVPSVDRAGRSIIHASCVIRAGEKDVAKALGTWAVRLPHLN